MYLAPSSIHFTQCTGETDVGDITKDIDLERLTAKFESKDTLPKIQVVEKDGHYFTLNNIQLQVFRKLEERGHCQNVKVEVIATKRVPVAIRDLMILPPDFDRNGYSTESHRLGKKGSSKDNDTDEDDEDDDDDDESTVTSCSVASSSESDTSDDEGEKGDESYDSSTSDSDAEEIEEERESLL
ncbi:myelin transcription factor 1-like protein [Ylistrum balloti]|uniref:myelin transcription factor 1-like protein n=1 Tax=Ylistrum balloti TaxID=509963 RepID=UPI002905F722|nr:myelin transcription factor 1-like protein [Ylistrum balloti]